MRENERGYFDKATAAGVKVAQIGSDAARQKAVQIGAEAARLKAATSHAMEERIVAARRLAKRGRRKADDLLDDAVHRIKRDPVRTVGLVFAVGLGLGALIGWLAGRGDGRYRA